MASSRSREAGAAADDGNSSEGPQFGSSPATGASPHCVLPAKALVGEGPVWSQSERALWWVDIVQQVLHRFEPESGLNRSWPMPGRPGCLALRRNGGVVVALPDGFAFFDPETGVLESLGGHSPGRTGARFNDGVVSPEGRFLATTMQSAPPFDAPIQTVQVLHTDLTTSRLTGGLRVGNGLAFSPDGGILYLADTHAHHAAVWSFDWHSDEARVSNQRLFFDPAQIAGLPDGAAVDSEGFYWFAAVGGWQIVRLTPDGRLDQTISVPVEKPTKVAFGGPDLKTLFVTSISIGLEPGTEANQPDAGGVFAVDVASKGLPTSFFGA